MSVSTCILLAQDPHHQPTLSPYDDLVLIPDSILHIFNINGEEREVGTQNHVNYITCGRHCSIWFYEVT